MRHPLHPALVHFPVACWSLATAADLASLHFGRPAWGLAGVLLAVGIACAIPTMLAGLLELVKIADGSPALKDVYRHMTAVMAALVLYAASLLLRLDGMALTAPGLVEIGLSVLGFGCLAVAGWLGGRLVYEHGVGQAHPLDAKRID
jgi:uncharacterized membrane protein